MIDIKTLKSPLTGKVGVKIICIIKSSNIIKACKEQINLNVSNYFEDIEKVYLLQCKESWYRFYYPYTVAGNSKLYEETQDSNDEAYYRKWGFDYEFAYSKIQNDEVVLDIGCGVGEFLKKIKHKTPYGYGLELNSVAYNKCINLDLKVFKESIEDHASVRPAYYDTVCIFQVLEHIVDVKSFLSFALKVLKPHGKLIIGVPNNEPYFQRFNKYIATNLPPHHMGLWNKKVFENLSKILDLKLKVIQYDEKLKWRPDAYYRAKLWLNLNEVFEKHTISTKLKLISLMALAAPFSYYKQLTSGINGTFLVVQFEKKMV